MKAAALSRFARELLGLNLGCTLLIAACGGQPPATFVGESQHFRLYVDPTLLPLPEAFAGENALAALETHWADFATMLKTPEGKITYYWYAPEHISDACGGAHVGGCTKEDVIEIDAPMLPDDHELIHAYTFARAPRRPTPFLAEGFAEAIGCRFEPPIPTSLGGDWRSAVAAVQSEEVYGMGGLFVRQMIRRHGIDDFLRYYEQSPERRDPALFAANFESFWGEPIDAVWAEINTVPPGVPFVDRKICPCSLPPIAPGTGITADPARRPYWTLPDAGDATIALTAGRYQQIFVRECAGTTDDLRGKAVLARLGAGAGGWYVTPNVVAADINRFVSDTCADAAHYPLSPDVLVGVPYVSVSIPIAEAATVYLAIDVPFALDSQVRGARAICDSCAFDEGSCATPTNGAAAPVTGSFYARLQFYASAAQVQAEVIDTQTLEFSR